MKITIGFIVFLISHCQRAINYEHVEKMFCLFVIESETDMEANLIYNMLTKEID